MKFKLYEEFLNESEEKFIPHDLALITIRHLVNENDVLTHTIYLSQMDRQAISKEWGNRLPRGFASAEKGMSIGDVLAPAIYYSPTWRNKPYFDGIDLVFGDYPLVFRCGLKTDSMDKLKYISSTWGELGDWLKKNMTSDENLLDLWLDSDLSLKDFREKYKGRIAANKFGL